MPTVDETVVKISADTSELESETQKGGRLMDKFIRDTQRRAAILNRIKMSPSATLIDRVTGPAKRIESALNRIGSAARRVTGAFTSPLGLLGAGVGMYGLGKSTLGAAMTWETQAVAMEHWLNGNKQLAQEVTSWLEKFAAATPFEMEDLFPSMSRAIGITDGDIRLSERMVKLAADMAGLTPGKTVRDAMEALADAQMGEFERLKEFQMKMAKEEMEKLGGFMGFLAAAESKFAGGAEKLSQTAIGRISTITDMIKTQFRSVGMGILESLKPRLDKITAWFNQNEETVAKWKDGLVRLGREASERLLQWGEQAFGRLKEIIEDPGFKQADWGGKIGLLLGEVTKETSDWLAGPGGKALTDLGMSMGKIIGEAFIGTFTGLMMDHPILRTFVLAYAGSKVPGPPAAKAVGVGAGVFSSVMLEGAIQLGKSAERRRAEQMEKIKEFGRVVDEFKADPSKFYVSGGEITARALGGFVNRPQLSLIGEAGPEVVIPLSSRIRSRALDLWQQTGRYLGVRQFEMGGFAGPVPAATHVGPIGGGINLFLGDTYVHINELRELDEDALALRIGRKIVHNVKKAIENRI